MTISIVSTSVSPARRWTHVLWRMSSSSSKLDEGDVFYFKGFGAGVDRMQSIFGVEEVVTRKRDLVEHFQNRIMFSSPDRCQLLN